MVRNPIPETQKSRKHDKPLERTSLNKQSTCNSQIGWVRETAGVCVPCWHGTSVANAEWKILVIRQNVKLDNKVIIW